MSEEHERVGIITLPGRFNYGNRLQNYAVTRIWEGLGYSPESLILGNRPNTIRSIKKVGKRLLGRKENPSPESMMSAERLAAFDCFNKSIPSREISGLNSILADEYALFSVGSDQVWNPDYITYNDDFYFLEFAHPEQRIALAPSIGLDSLNFWQARRLARGVMNFTHLSVRERRGAELIEECSGRDAEVICDPTLVLSVDEWREIADGHCTPNGAYVFTYLLGGVSDEVQAVLTQVTDNGCIPVVTLSDREKSEEPSAGPAEFVDLVSNAAHVVTDSFHASVFSAIMETPLTIVRRGATGAGIFSRLECLAQTLGIEDKIYTTGRFDISRMADYEGVADRIMTERAKFTAYLESCLDR